jgi:hypothetical protein
MPKSTRTIELIYQRVGNGKDLTYGSYLGWITLALAKRFRWFWIVFYKFGYALIKIYLILVAKLKSPK